ncbi:MAG: AEC family transporter [Alphaproteobacteria bacterium]|nr:AEC family transporter [Alphaproteobacteria bacterium]
MSAIVDIIVPVFGIVALGWVIGRSRLLSAEGLRGFTNITFYALFPALLFRSMARVQFETLDADILFAFFGAALSLYALLLLAGRALALGLADRAVFALSGTFSNGVGIGIPFITLAFGPAGLVPLLMIVSVHSLILLSLSSFLLEVGTQGGRAGLARRLGGAALTMLRHPVVPPIFAGLLWSWASRQAGGLALPGIVDRVLEALATAAPPCGLLMAGASLAHVGLRGHWQAAALASAAKLLVLPALVYALGRYVFALDPLWLAVATLNACLPAGANVYMVAQLYGVGVGRATNAVVISTAASIVTLSLALLIVPGVPGR